MRFIQLVPAALVLCVAVPANAQEWIEYANREDGFSVNFPGQPQVRDITWPSEYGLTFRGRVYSAERGAERYSLTVIDYSDAEKRYAALNRPQSPFSLPIYWQIDIMASIQYAATKLYRQRPGAKVTYDAWHYINRVSGHMLYLTNADRSMTHAGIYLHENRLYIVEGTVPPNAAEPGLFTQSLGLLDANGNEVQYSQIYSNRLPPVTMGGQGGGGRGRGQGPAQDQPQR